MQPMSQPHRTKRVKTEGDKLVAQLERQKSIFQNLSWQMKQRERKISFLQRYYGQLKAVIRKEKEEDSALMKRAHPQVQRIRQKSYNKSNIVRQLYPSERKRRIVTEISHSNQGYSILNQSSVNTSSQKLSYRRR